MPHQGVWVRVPPFAPTIMSIATEATVEPSLKTVDQHAGFSTGSSTLDRRTVVRLSANKIERDLNRVLLREATRLNAPGFRKSSKVVPPAFRKAHEKPMLERIMRLMAGEVVSAMLKEEDLKVFPGMRIVGHSHDESAGTYEVECGVEVFPEIPSPDFTGKKLRKPVPLSKPEAVDAGIENIRRSLANWQAVERPARDGDRIRFRFAGMSDEQEDRSIPLGDPRLDPKVAERFQGVSVGDEISLEGPSAQEGDDPVKVQVTVTAVEWGQLPDKDLDLARAIDPEVGSFEAFRENLSARLDKHAISMADDLEFSRMLYLLDSSTLEFDMPEQHVDQLAIQRVNAIIDEANEKKVKPSDVQLDKDLNSAIVKHDLRRSLILNKFLIDHKIEVSDQEIEEGVRELAEQSEDPRAFMAAAKKNAGIIEKAREGPLMRKAREAIEELVEVERVEMDTEEISALMQGTDPEAPPPDWTKPKQ